MERKEMSLKELKKYDTYLFTIADIEVRDKEIERLNKELQDTKEHLGEYLHEQEEENKRLNNIINELERLLNNQIENYKDSECEELQAMVQEDKSILFILKELKGSNSNE